MDQTSGCICNFQNPLPYFATVSRKWIRYLPAFRLIHSNFRINILQRVVFIDNF